MEHIVQFGVTLDDEKIEKMVMSKASDECLAQIRKATSNFCKDDYYGDSQLKEMFKEEVKRVILDNKEEIIGQVIKQVSANLLKTKEVVAAKAKLVDSLNS